jgi:hypothetical protein
MAIVDTVYSVFERLAAAKLNLMVTEINNHNHDGTNGVQISGSNISGVVLTTTDQTVNGLKTFVSGLNAGNSQVTGMCIENRTNDTGCTQTGRIWLRTDI